MPSLKHYLQNSTIINILTGNFRFFWPTEVRSTWKGQGGAWVHRESRGTGSMLLFQGVVAEITILIMANLFLTARCQCIQGQSQSLNKNGIIVLKIKKNIYEQIRNDSHYN